MKKILLSLGVIGAVITPAIAMTSCDKKENQKEVSANQILSTKLNYSAKWDFILKACGIENIHSEYSKAEKNLLDKSEIKVKDEIGVASSWAWKILSNGVTLNREGYEALLESKLLKHVCSKDRDFKLKNDITFKKNGKVVSGTSTLKGATWTENGKNVEVSFTTEKDGITIKTIEFNIGDSPKKTLYSGRNYPIVEQDETNFINLLREFSSFVKSELTEEQLETFINLNTWHSPIPDIKTSVKELLNMPNDIKLEYYATDTIGSPTMIKFGGKTIGFAVDGFNNEWETNAKNIEELNAYLKNYPNYPSL